MRRKYTFDYVRDYINGEEGNGCTLLSAEYVDSKTPLLIQCACGETFEKTFTNFKRSKKQCDICNGLITWDFQKVKDYIEGEEGNGCKLLSPEYVDNKTKLKIQCACGEEFEKTFHAFKDGKQKQCPKCGCKNGAKKQENQIIFNCDYCGKECGKKKSEFDKNTHHFCSKECYNEFHSNQATFNCDYCEKQCSREKWALEGKEHHFCSRECMYKWQSENIRGKAHHSYNHNITDEEREKGRFTEGSKQWREDVYERDNYTCQCCGDNKGGNLNAHHLNSYHWDKEHRIDINNGVALCKKCHDEYHKIYGYKNNTIAQFKEFLFNKYIQSHDLKFLALIETIDLTTRAF